MSDHNALAQPRDNKRKDTSDESGVQRAIDHSVEFRWLAIGGALLAAAAPAIMATTQGNMLEGSVSAYWDVSPRYYFWAPFTAASLLLFADGALSWLRGSVSAHGRRWYNIVLGCALLALTWFDKDNYYWTHRIAAGVFFALFIAVIAYTSLLGLKGRHIVQAGPRHNEELERLGAKTSSAFLGLLLATLALWAVDAMSFYFFEVFALVNFALYYVQGFFVSFPYKHYEFTFEWVNRVFRKLRIMPARLATGQVLSD